MADPSQALRKLWHQLSRSTPHTAATTRVTALHDQLAMAEGFARTLRDNSTNHGGSIT
jgi:hypothetical protein